MVGSWKEKLAKLIKGYDIRDISNVDETGLFYCALPTKSLILKNKKSVGKKLSEERLTNFVCGYMDDQFEEPIVIGKAENPRYFKNIDKKKLPVEWDFNKKAWMTAHIMIT